MQKFLNKLLRSLNLVTKILHVYFTLILLTKKINMKLLSGIVGGFILALLGAIFITSLIVAFSQKNGLIFGSIAFLILWVIGILIALMAKSMAKAWGRLLILIAFFSFCMPFAGLFFTSAGVSVIIEKGGEFIGTSATGTAILGTILSAIMGVIGFSFGAFFLLIGLHVGRNKSSNIPESPFSEI